MGQDIYTLLDCVKIPKMSEVRQIFYDDSIDDIKTSILDKIAKKNVKNSIKPNMRIAITAGSRGIDRIPFILQTIVEFVRAHGGKPFIIPAMGSHGGATSSGQIHILHSLGITESTCRCPIISDMETVQVASLDDNTPVYIDKNAAFADGIIVINKIKPHTAFRGKYESGLMKMIAIGLGKQYGAKICHSSGFKEMARNIERFSTAILSNTNILFSVGLIENEHSKIYKICPLLPKEIPNEEPFLLEEARSRIGRILLPETDVLLVDQIGKNFSGDGMDPNVTGTFATPYAHGGIKAQKVGIFDLSPQTNGSIVGAGVADVGNRRLLDKGDLESSYVNAMTSTVYDCVRLPMLLKSDKYVIAACIIGLNDAELGKEKIIRISNTLHIENIWVSESLLPLVERHPAMEILSASRYLDFDANGNLV